MKRVLNLSEFSGPALAAIAITGLVIPGPLRLVSRLVDRLGQHLPALEGLARFFLVTGGVLLLLFFVLVVVEQIQDAVLYRHYLRDRGQHVEGDCPFCGNREIRAFELYCRVCGEQLNHSWKSGPYEP